jgi:hypothetical protein
VNTLFWRLVFWIASFLSVPLDLAITGLNGFMFWQH